MAAAQWGIAGYWVNSYWGGAVAAGAGGLVFGALPRLARRPSAGVAAMAALGIVTLANSRPYEGAVAVAAAGVALLVWRRGVHRPWGELAAWRVAGPAAAILICGAAAMLYYNYRLTGHPLLLPYNLHQRTYGMVPSFWILPLGAQPVYRHEMLRRLWVDYELALYRPARAWPPHVLFLFWRTLWYFFLTIVSTIALLAAVVLRRSRKVWIALALALTVSVALLLEKYPNAHYFAPATGLVLLLIVLGAQYLRVKGGRGALVAFAALFFVTAGVHACFLSGDEYPHKHYTAERLRVAAFLARQPGRQLAIVRYGAGHDAQEDWTFNHADIDGSQTVWARDMGDEGNGELIGYFRGRKVWLVEPEGGGGQVTTYSRR